MSKLENLTCIQVEALRECLDFLKNGYQRVGSVNYQQSCIVKFRHTQSKSVIIVFSSEWAYTIKHDGKLKKVVKSAPDDKRYACLLDSVDSLKVTPFKGCAARKFILGSVLPKPYVG